MKLLKRSIWAIILFIAAIGVLIMLVWNIIDFSLGINEAREAIRQSLINHNRFDNLDILTSVSFSFYIVSFALSSLLSILIAISALKLSLRGKGGFFIIIFSLLSIACGIWYLIKVIQANNISNIVACSISLAIYLVVFIASVEVKKYGKVF